MSMRASLLAEKGTVATSAILGLYTVVLCGAVVATLYFGREIFVPLALATLVTFILTPSVTFLERRVGRIAAVSAVAVIFFFVASAIAWAMTRQAMDVVTQLPSYRTNIEKKVAALELDNEGPITRFARLVSDIESQIPLLSSQPSAPPGADGPQDLSVRPDFDRSTVNPLNKWPSMIGPLLQVVASSIIVFVLVIFMLLKREDLRGRLIKLSGRGRISSTSRVLEDSAARLSRYLITQLIVNTAFGTTVGAGLYFIGVPNAFLWGALAALLRFVPYVGAFLAAVCPVALALAVSPGWSMVLLTVALFVVLDLVTGYLLEPLLYRSSTGVSSLALILAAIFWTWLWGPVGLLLSTPLTVCLAVVGTHVSRLRFLSILLGNEEALSPAEDCYHRLLIDELAEAGKAVDLHLQAHSLTVTFDEVLLPALAMAELDFQRNNLDEQQHNRVLQGLRDIIADLALRRPADSLLLPFSQAEDGVSRRTTRCRVFTAAPRGERDEIAGSMAALLLPEHAVEARMSPPNVSVAQLLQGIAEFNADVVCVSVVPPTTLIHARHLCAQLRAAFPGVHIVVGLWGAKENVEDDIKSVRSAGANEVVVSLAEAVGQISKLSSTLLEKGSPMRTAADEEARVAAVLALQAYQSASNPAFDKLTSYVARTFNVPIALVTLIDRDRQHFKARFGVPDEFAAICEIPRGDAVCNHVVADDAPLVVEDLTRDRRFSGNPILKKFGLRFYAGIPLHAPNGQPVGALCLLDTKPRKFSDSDLRLFKILAAEASESLINAKSSGEPDFSHPESHTLSGVGQA